MSEDYTLGQPVTFTTHLRRRTGNQGTTEPRKLWSTTGKLPATGEHHGGEGIIIGKRKLANGDRYWEEEVGYIFEPKEYFDAYLVAFAMHRSPVYVLPEHLAPAEPEAAPTAAPAALPGQTAIDELDLIGPASD